MTPTRASGTRSTLSTKRRRKKEQRLSTWERNGGCRLGGRNREALAFRAEHAGKTLAEKLELLKDTQYMGNFCVNADGTVTAGNGCHLCVMKKLKPPYTVSSTVFVYV